MEYGTMWSKWWRLGSYGSLRKSRCKTALLICAGTRRDRFGDSIVHEGRSTAAMTLIATVCTGGNSRLWQTAMATPYTTKLRTTLLSLVARCSRIRFAIWT